ncbi:class A beta-lactamase-related serine hydrolase [Candidatus Synechococcus calcipolaris G9]|uniref:Class A beta-lactamase-related serine hydrolase n=1 Tax=Candidatus Synechococcus calcipolaris G9 TaxID=1497997 RepID=A0ABT6EWM7_9SYNE|nr:serine hydrolase [Candidatus Synechococcus calcipolaris]MDG2990181.1 class A beta-lactamase-related serine hydrolase [Candidatus Synechococcus calcipolaris G9]
MGVRYRSMVQQSLLPQAYKSRPKALQPKKRIVLPPLPKEETTVSAVSGPRPNLILVALRVIIATVALAAIAGTVISALHPEESQNEGEPESIQPVSSLEAPLEPELPPEQPLADVQNQVQQLITARPTLEAGLYFFNLDSGAAVDVKGDQIFPAASTIKIPVLVAFFQAIDSGQIDLNEALVMRPDLIAPEAGTMQYQKPGTKFPALEVADLMITISDNTATNMLIDRLGGADVLNQKFIEWGLTDTAIHNLLPDMKGTNTTSPKDLATLMLKISQGDLVTPRSRDRLLDIMRRTVTNTLLPQGIGEGATIAHKTGDIGIVVGDAGMVDMANGQRYVAAMMVKRPYNDPQGSELIRQVSRLTYQAFEKGSQ